ncbi:MAG TPA: thermostable hemolysin [Burkholderiales bacterium]|nr:thermostable hemolysin [Burkholderiales bacterium]
MQCDPEKLVMAECGRTDRDDVERFIHAVFASAYGASVKRFMPRLFSVRSGRNEIQAAFGMRSAEGGRLFLETYLDQPIEQVIRESCGRMPRRRRIAEIGNLVAVHPGAVRWLISALAEMLHDEGYEWVAFTGTAGLRNSFRNLGLRPLGICEARPERLLPEEIGNWGAYYDKKPFVMVGDVYGGLRAMRAKELSLLDKSRERGGLFKSLGRVKQCFQDFSGLRFSGSCSAGQASRHRKG